MTAIAALPLAMPLLALCLVPLVQGRAGQWLLAFLALLPGAAFFTGGSLSLPWLMLGTGLAHGFPVSAAIALQALLFALALLPGPGAVSSPRADSACLLLAQGALLAALLAVDLLLLLAGLTVASYALLASRLRAARPLPGRLAAVAVFLAAGDLAAFELALLLAKAAGDAVIPTVAAAGGAVEASAVIAAFAVGVVVSRGALLLLFGITRRAGAPLLALLFLALPALAWRLQGFPGALAAVLSVVAGGLLALAFAALFTRAGPALHALARRLAKARPGSLPGPSGRLPEALARAELRLGSWEAAFGGLVVLVILVLIGTGVGGN